MQFHASKIVSVLILLNTTICLAMQKNGGYNPFGIGIASVTCENRVYSKPMISMAIINGLQNIDTIIDSNMNLEAIQYIPLPMEEMPSIDEFYFSELQRSGPNGPADLVIFSSSGLFAKVVTRVLDSHGLKYKDCVPSQTTMFPQQLQHSRGNPGQNSGVYDPFGIGITSVSCEGRVYDKQQISEAIEKGMTIMARMTQLQMDPDLLQYKPKPTEVMPSQDDFYYSNLNNPRPNEPEDLVVFSASGQFTKAVIQKQDGSEPYRKDCVSSSNRQSFERSSSRMGSPERHRLRMKSP